MLLRFILLRVADRCNGLGDVVDDLGALDSPGELVGLPVGNFS